MVFSFVHTSPSLMCAIPSLLLIGSPSPCVSSTIEKWITVPSQCLPLLLYHGHWFSDFNNLDRNKLVVLKASVILANNSLQHQWELHRWTGRRERNLTTAFFCLSELQSSSRTQLLNWTLTLLANTKLNLRYAWSLVFSRGTGKEEPAHIFRIFKIQYC